MPKEKKQSTDMVKWEEQMARDAKIDSDAESSAGGGNIIGTAGGRFKIDSGFVPDNKLQVLVIDHIFANMLYEGAYDATNPSSPVCFAFGRVEKEMVPHEKSEKPQAETCAECEHNEWGSAGPGRKGKTVRNSRRLALIAQSDVEDGNVADAKVRYLHVPPTSLNDWAGYLHAMDKNVKRSAYGVFTEIEIHSDPIKMFYFTFKLLDKVPGEYVEGIMKRRQTVMTEIDFPYPPNVAKPAASVVAVRRQGRVVAPAAAPVATASFGRKAKPKY